MTESDFEIVRHPHEQYKDYHRLVYRPTGEESSYYTLDECKIIIGHAIEGRLLGTFLIDVGDEP